MTEEVEGVIAEAAPSEPNNDVKDSAQSVESKPEQTIEQRAEAAEKAKQAMEKRIARQTAAYRDLQRKYEETAKIAEQYKPKEQSSVQPPKEDDFRTTEEYLIAKGKFEARQEFEAEARQKTQAEQQRAFEQKRAALQEKVATLEAQIRESYTDYDDVTEVVNMAVASAPDGMGKTAFSQFLVEADNPPMLAYTLGQNPELLEKMGSMSPIQIIKELTKLEMGISEPKTRTETKPKPPKPVQGSGKVSTLTTKASGAEILKRLGMS